MSSMDNPIQFAVVREDPLIEKELVELYKPKKALLIGGGGCTAYTLATLFPELHLTLVDTNPAQLQLIERKAQALQRLGMDPSIVNIGSETPQGLNACGNFETLFRCMRDFWRALILRGEELEHMFDSQKRLQAATETLTSHRYWPVSFDLFFSDEMLTTMFGARAIQHALKGSYSHYFRAMIEKGLKSSDALENHFLHHAMLGHYLETKRDAWPLYLQRPPREFQAEMLNCAIEDVPSFAAFDFVNLSNIFDWSSLEEVKKLATRLDAELPTGAVVMWRQLNNDVAFEMHFKVVKFDEAHGQMLLEKDRSLFSTGLKLGIKA